MLRDGTVHEGRSEMYMKTREMARLNSRTHLRSDAAREKVRSAARWLAHERGIGGGGGGSFLSGYNAPRNSPFSMIYVSLTRRDNEKICRLFMTSVQRLTGSFISLPAPPTPPPPTAFFRTFFFLTRIFRIFYFSAFDRCIVHITIDISHIQ